MADQKADNLHIRSIFRVQLWTPDGRTDGGSQVLDYEWEIEDENESRFVAWITLRGSMSVANWLA